jgi:serine/threonine protein phosphatase PrpC
MVGRDGMRPVLAGNCPECGMPLAGPGDFCERCGRRAQAGRDHLEIDLDTLVGVTDRGTRHHRNEDAMALAATQTPDGAAALAVVCDGVSTSDQPDMASLVAAEAARRVLVAAARAGTASAEALTDAVAAAGTAVGEIDASAGNAPATTIVCAVASAAVVTVCWVGDSRAYWLPARPGSADLDPSGARLLTRDDSVAEELVTAGALTEAEAAASRHAHVLTRWLGADARRAAPHTAQFEPAGPGVLMLCSDGLWNYEPDAAALAALAPRQALTSLPGTAATLLEFALDRGGDDNITIVLVAFPPRQGADQPSDPTSLPAI